MGEKKVTTRTLSTGEKVAHHPDGRQVLQPRNSLGGLLAAQEETQDAASTELREALVQTATDKRGAQLSGDPVPSDKSVV